MSETPKNPAGEMTDRIMLAIKEHIRSVEPFEHHYNRAWEKVYALLATVPVTRVPSDGTDRARLCRKLIARVGSVRQCGLLKGHAGECLHV